MPTQTTAIFGLFQAISSSFANRTRVRSREKRKPGGKPMISIAAIGFSYACLSSAISRLRMKGGAGRNAGIATPCPAAVRQSRKVR